MRQKQNSGKEQRVDGSPPGNQKKNSRWFPGVKVYSSSPETGGRKKDRYGYRNASYTRCQQDARSNYTYGG